MYVRINYVKTRISEKIFKNKIEANIIQCSLKYICNLLKMVNILLDKKNMYLHNINPSPIH